MLFLTLISCGFVSGDATPPPAAEAPAPTAARDQAELVYVQASRLTLRTEPDGDAITSLGINTRLRVREKKSGWLAVTVPDGTDGWVHGDYVAAQRITSVALQTAIEAETDAEARLSLWQRAAALAPTDPAVLEGLAIAYTTVGDEEAAAKVRRVMAAGLERFDGWFPAQAAEVDAVRAELETASDAAALIALWTRAKAVTEAMAEALNSRYDGDAMTFTGGDPEPMLKARLPYAELGFYAEGTWAGLELSPEAWQAAAARTAEPWDDDFIQLLVDSYGNASGGGWGAWQVRNWDYGGCSPLGSGLHKSLLLQTDGLAGRDQVAVPVAAVRTEVLQDIEQPNGPGEFPYCDVASGDATPVAALDAEARAILAQVQLDVDERAMIEARIAAGFPGQ